METVEISVAVVTYRVGVARRKAFSGDVIEVDAAEAERLRSIGAVATEPTGEPPTEPEPEQPAGEQEQPQEDEDDDKPEPVERPKQAAPKAVWVEYAVATGMDRNEAEALEKRELIAALS